MGKQDFITGSVLEFKVPLDLGYAYCKVLDFRHISKFDGVLAKVYDCIVKEPLKDINVLREKDWLFGARRMPDLPNTRGKGAWKFKGVLIAEADNIIPDFKDAPLASPLIEDLSTISKWYVVRNISEVYENVCSYDQVKHLEDTVLTTQLGIEARTAMEYCRTHDMRVDQYFNLNEDRYNFTYLAMSNMTVYSTIPKEIRGKALC